ncbi:cell adhesion molecule Dscam2-like isoform X4 [Macrobrachium rosenbergii]|uniref:cell adhesion molecule Dscam2-like isoform X4 n=1 Tax=Macrobrachium rosenbergii TaxID=79674 RepID=UPI0034D66664
MISETMKTSKLSPSSKPRPPTGTVTRPPLPRVARNSFGRVLSAGARDSSGAPVRATYGPRFLAMPATGFARILPLAAARAAGIARVPWATRPKEPGHEKRPAQSSYVKFVRRLMFALIVFSLRNEVLAVGRGTQGPSFTIEPPRTIHFTNSTGATVNCMAEGTPPPSISWTNKDGRIIDQVPGLREVLANGSLSFPPFAAARYHQQVHGGTYICRATSPAGTLLALPTQVRAVVVGEYEVQVYDQVVMSGNTGVLRCAIPSYVREYVTVTSWLHDNSFNIYPSLHGDGKYHMTAEGELHVLDVGPQDGLSRFQCRTLHKLTGRTQLSTTPARIIVTEAQGSVPPRISERAGRMVVQAGSRVTLPCVAQGHPPPHYTWYRGSTPLAASSSSSSGGIWAVGGSLVLGSVDVSDAGEYTCVANNTAGETRFSAHLLVTTPLSVQVTPREVQVDAGGRLELKCHVSGDPVDTVTWFKDGQVLRSGDRIRIRPRESLHLAPVEASDAGIYQCEASYADDYAHALAYVTLGAAAPKLAYRFIEQTLKPGPAVSLKCIATGTPTPHITWALDGFPLPHSHRYLKGQYVSAHGDVISHVNISMVHVTDGGTYTCTAENSAGKVSHSARLNIYGAPHVRPMGQVSAVAGETFAVTCPASGYPLEKIVWKKDTVRLPTSHRQRVYPNGTLVVEQVTRGTDDGQYSCSAFSRQGRSDTQTLNVRVMVPPRLANMAFPVGTRAGMRAQATCLMQEGDQPLTFAWQKDGRPLDGIRDVRTSQLDAFTSILVIERASAEHSGNYTCAATNPARTSTVDAQLTVSVPPTWVVEPSSANVPLGGHVALHCLAKGFPNPTVVWRKETASGVFSGVATGEGGVAGWENGTLSVSRAERRHEGRYLCEANNNVGAGLSKVVTLSVNEPPWFGVRSQRQQVVVGATATLACEAHGDTPLNLAWTRDSTPLPALPRYEVSEREVDTGRVSELVLHTTHVGDSGTYVCTATNAHGSLTADFHLLVQDVPGPPSGVGVSEESSRYLTLTWTPPEDSNAPISAYLVTFTSQDTHQTSNGLFVGPREVTVEGDQRKVRIDGLLPATTYIFTVVAENRVGRSQPSSPLRITTQEEAPSGHPQNVRVVAVSSTALQVTWEPPFDNLTHGTILGYYLGFKDDSESEGGAYNFTTVGVDGAGATTATLAGLRPHAHYSVVLQAFNSRGAGPTSPPAIATTLEDKPSAPPGHVTCEAVTARSLVVTWKPPPTRHINGVITNYRVTYSVSSSHAGGRSGSMVSEGLRATLTALLPWTNYSVTVAASTRAGEGVSSLPLICTTNQDVPEAPARVKAVVSGPRAAVVAWSPPINPHGRITRYSVHWSSAGGRGPPHTRHVGAHFTHLTLHDLPHTTHQVWVTASTRVGEGPSSSVATVKPSHTVGAGIWAVGGNLTAAWKEDVSLPCGAVGVPEPTLTWTHEGKHIPQSHNRFTVQPDGTLTLADIQRRDSGVYMCTATNHHGSDKVAYNLTVLVPPSAPSLHVTETTASSIRVQWSVEDTGGAPLQGATLHYRSVGGEWLTAEVEGLQRAYTATGLKCGTLHHFYLTARNYIGTSSASTTVGARTKGRAPEPPPQFQFVTTNSSQATLYLAQWGDGGCPITHFAVQYRKDGTQHWTTVGSEIPPSRTFAVTGLEARGQYQLRVTAHNSAGSTPFQYLVTTPGRSGTGSSITVNEGVWGSATSTSPVWRDPRVLVPAAVSAMALLLTITTVCVCLRKRTYWRMFSSWTSHMSLSSPRTKNLDFILGPLGRSLFPDAAGPSSSAPQKEMPDSVTTKGSDEKTAMQARDESVYTTVRRPPPAPPQPTPELRDNTDYSEEELYPYATATFQLGRGSPPPPAPPSPPNHQRGQKAFTALVYQAPSLHDVDSPNLVLHQTERESRAPRGFPYEGSETEDYGTSIDGASDVRQPAPHHRRPRHIRTRSPATSGSPKSMRQAHHQHTLRHPKHPRSPAVGRRYSEGGGSLRGHASDAECDLRW